MNVFRGRREGNSRTIVTIDGVTLSPTQSQKLIQRHLGVVGPGRRDETIFF